MYDNNYLAKRLRQSSLEREQSICAQLSDGREVTYGEMFLQAEKIAALLIDLGIAPGDRIAVQVEKSIEAIQLYLGIVIAGGIYLPLNTAYTTAELDYFLSDARPALLVCSPEKYTDLNKLAEKIPISQLLTLTPDGTGSVIDMANRFPSGFDAVQRTDTDIACILYTSGTTGRSKGAMLSHGSLASNALTLKEYWQFSTEDILIHALPIFHTHGMFVAINTTFIAGSSFIFHKKFDAPTILNDMLNATVLMGVPTFYVRLLELSELDKTKTSNMRLFISGSAPLLAETHNQWQQRTGHNILERYGMTETNMNTSNPYHGERRAGTVGFPLPGIEVVITDQDSGMPLPQGEIGSIEIRGPNVFSGYWQNPEKTAEDLRENGFFITGDIGQFDQHGYLTIIGRSKDLIISGGYNIYPKEIENLINDITGVNESAVIGLPHPDFGEAVVAVIVNEPDADVDEATVMEMLMPNLAKFKQPKRIFFIAALPRNTMGKVQKNNLRDTYSDTFSPSSTT